MLAVTCCEVLRAYTAEDLRKELSEAAVSGGIVLSSFCHSSRCTSSHWASSPGLPRTPALPPLAPSSPRRLPRPSPPASPSLLLPHGNPFRPAHPLFPSPGPAPPTCPTQVPPPLIEVSAELNLPHRSSSPSTTLSLPCGRTDLHAPRHALSRSAPSTDRPSPSLIVTYRA